MIGFFRRAPSSNPSPAPWIHRVHRRCFDHPLRRPQRFPFVRFCFATGFDNQARIARFVPRSIRREKLRTFSGQGLYLSSRNRGSRTPPDGHAVDMRNLRERPSSDIATVLGAARLSTQRGHMARRRGRGRDDGKLRALAISGIAIRVIASLEYTGRAAKLLPGLF